MMNGQHIGSALTGVCLMLAGAGLVLIFQTCTGCAIWQHEEARSAAEMGCVERYKTRDQIEACREVVNGITSQYAKDAGSE